MNDIHTPPQPAHSDWVESLYERLAEDDEGRVCTAISDDACRESPGNFLRTLVANALSNISDRIAGAKTTLPWLLSHLGAPAWCLSLLVPIRESGSMLPQMLIGGIVRRQAVRKWVWVGGACVQGLSLMLMGVLAFMLEGLAAGLAVLALLTVFSVARGACSVAYKDVLGKTIPKTRRGRLSGWISAVAGGAAMVAGAGLGIVSDTGSTAVLALLLFGGAAMWAGAAFAYGRIVEEPGATEGGANGLAEAVAKFSLLRDDVYFRRFVIARALAMGSGLVAPFYIVLARDDLGSAASLLGLFIAVEGLASLASSPVWGRWADRSSRLVFAVASGLAGGLSMAVALWSWWSPAAEASLWFYPLAFFGLGVAHAGVRLGRKTYLVDMAEGNRRTDYVAVSNTAIGFLLLFAGLLGAVTALFSIEATIFALGVAGVAGAVQSSRWKDVSGASTTP